MKKIILVFIFNLFLSTACLAQSNYTESLTITTYYPAPYGVYRDLLARKSFAVGNFTSNEVQALKPGQLQVEDSIVYKPRSDDPANWPKTGPKGEMAYSSNKDDMYFFNGATWKAIGSAATPTIPTTPITPTTPAPPVVCSQSTPAACTSGALLGNGCIISVPNVVPGCPRCQAGGHSICGVMTFPATCAEGYPPVTGCMSGWRVLMLDALCWTCQKLP